MAMTQKREATKQNVPTTYVEYSILLCMSINCIRKTSCILYGLAFGDKFKLNCPALNFYHPIPHQSG
jgi:hypothetical protein